MLVSYQKFIINKDVKRRGLLVLQVSNKYARFWKCQSSFSKWLFYSWPVNTFPPFLHALNCKHRDLKQEAHFIAGLARENVAFSANEFSPSPLFFPTDLNRVVCVERRRWRSDPISKRDFACRIITRRRTERPGNKRRIYGKKEND